MIALVVTAAPFAFAQSPSAGGVHTQVEDIRSTLSRRAARTTTITETFQYDLKHPNGVAVLFNGCRGSKIEPCGCRALNLGGIDKEAAMVESIRHENKNNIFLDAGGFFREFTDPGTRLQTWHMMEALLALDIRAVNIGYPDVRQGMATLKHFQTHFGLPFVSANIVNATSGEPLFAPYKTYEMNTANGKTVKIAVVGVTAKNRDDSRRGAILETTATKSAAAVPVQRPGARGRWMIAETNGTIPWFPYDVHDHPMGGASPTPAAGGSMSAQLKFAVEGEKGLPAGPVPSYRIKEPLEAAQEIGPRLKAEGYFVILLAYTSHDTAVAMAKELPAYDLIITGDYIRREEPIQPWPDRAMIVSGDHDGKYLGLVEIAIGPDETRAATADLLPILQSIKPDPEFTKYIERFASDTASLPVEESPAELTEKLYAGERSCRTCHVDASKQWKSHHHSRAMKALVDKNMHFNPDCLKCHTVAYRMPGGFTDLRVTANLANVQCEVCHGPGEAHVQEMRAAEALAREGKPVPPMQTEMRMEWDANFCMQCHDPQNDPHFNFAEDILRVRHKNPAPARVRPTTVSLEMM